MCACVRVFEYYVCVCEYLSSICALVVRALWKEPRLCECLSTICAGLFRTDSACQRSPGNRECLALNAGWLRLVGSLKLYVSFAQEPYKRNDIVQKKPIISRSLLIVFKLNCNNTAHTRTLTYTLLNCYLRCFSHTNTLYTRTPTHEHPHPYHIHSTTPM